MSTNKVVEELKYALSLLNDPSSFAKTNDAIKHARLTLEPIRYKSEGTVKAWAELDKTRPVLGPGSSDEKQTRAEVRDRLDRALSNLVEED